MNLFGKKKATPQQQQSSPINTIALLDSQIETLYKRDHLLNAKVESCKREALAKKKRGDKTGALIALKKSNRYQEETKKLQGTIMTLENQKMALESAAMDVETIRAMQQANEEMKRTRVGMDAGKIDDIMDDIEEQKDISDQISEALTRNTADMFDDDELLAELEGLEDEMALIDEADQEKAPVIPTRQQQQISQPPQKNTTTPEVVFNFPNAPQGTLQPQQRQPVKETEDERALRELQESMLA